MILNKLIIFLNIISIIFAANSGDSDEVLSLPGLKQKPSFHHYSGYLNVSEGRHIHYWFVTSQLNPSKDPVVLWLNGGPGCSSLGGMFTEIGPWRFSNDYKTLTDASHSWNKMANLLFFESPVGVGYSYHDTNNVNTSDEHTAQGNYEALIKFFEKFPQFKSNDFYITGESYAGVYIPMLALKMFIDNSTINLKGISIGNGLLNSNNRQTSQIYYFYSHGIMDNKLWNDAEKYCCNCHNNSRVCDFSQRNIGNTTDEFENYMKCYDIVEDIQKEVIWTKSGINPYNILKDCNYGSASNDETDSHLRDSQYFIDRIVDLENAGLTNLLEQLESDDNNDDTYSVDKSPCTNAEFSRYFNNPDVRKAIHIPEHTSKWGRCNHDVTKNYHRQMLDTKPLFNSLIHGYKLPIIIYNGDLDTRCDFLGEHYFVNSLGLPVVDKYRPWKFDNETAGFVKRYKGLTFIVIKGAGHMVPEDKPGPAFEIYKELIGHSKLTV